MKNVFFKKILTFFFSLFCILTLTFFLMKLIPGDPFTDEKELPKEILDALYAHYGLNKPLFIQYLKYIKGFFTFNFGYSMIYEGRTVTEIIKTCFPISFILGIQALLFSLTIGICLGCISAVKKSKWQDHLTENLTLLGAAVPGFLLATFLQYFFSVKLGWLPAARWGSFSHTILPTLSLSLFPITFISKLIRNNMIEILQKDFIKLAYTKGLSPFKVILKHALPNCILPVISYLGPLSAQILTGSFVIEKIFGIPGLGGWMITSISQRDYPFILGITCFYSFILLTLILFFDLLLAFIDPRIEIKENQ